MKKILILGAFVAFVCNVSFASSYKIDQSSVDAIFAVAEESNLSDDVASLFNTNGVTATLVSDPNPWAAWAICWVVGEFGVHRHYMGTKSNMWAIYTFTCCGIFGIVPVVDWVVLLVGAIKGDISKYVNNDSFFMW